MDGNPLLFRLRTQLLLIFWQTFAYFCHIKTLHVPSFSGNSFWFDVQALCQLSRTVSDSRTWKCSTSTSLWASRLVSRLYQFNFFWLAALFSSYMIRQGRECIPVLCETDQVSHKCYMSSYAPPTLCNVTKPFHLWHSKNTIKNVRCCYAPVILWFQTKVCPNRMFGQWKSKLTSHQFEIRQTGSPVFPIFKEILRIKRDVATTYKSSLPNVRIVFWASTPWWHDYSRWHIPVSQKWYSDVQKCAGAPEVQKWKWECGTIWTFTPNIDKVVPLWFA